MTPIGMPYRKYPDGLTPSRFEAIKEERLRLMERFVRYNDKTTLNGRPKKSVIAIRMRNENMPRFTSDNEPEEEFYETVKTAAQAMRVSKARIMYLASNNRYDYRRKWRYATRADLERMGII